MTRRDETFLLYYWEDFEQYQAENPCGVYCISESSVQIILSALRFSGWRTRWRLDRQDYSRSFSDDIIWDKIDALAALAQEEMINDMGCDFNEGLAAIADAIVASSNATALEHLAQAVANQRPVSSACCQDEIISQNGGISGSTQQGGVDIPIFGTQPPLGVDPGTFPDGYDSLEDYLQDKCQVANLVLDGFIASLRGLGALGVFNYIALAGLIVVAIAGAIVFPPAFIPIAAASLGFLALEVTTLTLFANEVEANRADWVCALYNSDTVEAATAAVADLIDTVIAFLALSGPVGSAVKTIALLLMNADTLNQLMTKTAHLLYEDADCSACECTLELWDFESGLQGWAFAADSCFGTTPSTAGSSVAAATGAMEMAAPHVGNPNAVNAAGPAISWEIRAGDKVRIIGRRVADNNNFIRLDVVTTESGCVQVGTGGFLYTDQSTAVDGDLSAIVGETIEQINIYVNNSTNLPIDVLVEAVYFGCEDEQPVP